MIAYFSYLWENGFDSKSDRFGSVSNTADVVAVVNTFDTQFFSPRCLVDFKDLQYDKKQWFKFKFRTFQFLSVWKKTFLEYEIDQPVQENWTEITIRDLIRKNCFNVTRFLVGLFDEN